MSKLRYLESPDFLLKELQHSKK